MSEIRVSHEQGKLRQEVFVGRHRLVADEPVEAGGEDTGPSPFDFLATALGTCTAITLRMYAQHKAWPLTNAEVIVDVQRAADATRLTRQIALVGELSDEQRQRLLEIANRCPVHKALSGKIEIETSLAGNAAHD